MPFKSTCSKVSILVFFAICCWSSTLRAQKKYTSLQFKIDSLAGIGLAKSALKLVDKLETMARAENNAPQQIKAVIYRMTFQSYLQEDAFVAIINRLKLDIVKAEYPVKPVLQSLLAQIYWNYYQQNRYRTTQRSKLQVLDTDFTKWDLQSIISQTAKLYTLSLQNAAQAQQTPMGILNGVLQGDSSTRYLRPTFYDLLLQRALTFFLSPEADLTKPKLPFSLNNPAFYGDSRSFAQLDIKTTDTASNFYKGLKYLQQATSFHLGQNNREALANLDLQRLKFLHQQVYEFDTDSLYLAGLQKVAMQFSDKPISADALVLIGQFYQGQDSLVKAHQVLMQAKIAFPNSNGGSNAAILLSQIEQKELSATVEDVNVSNKPILGLINYRNVSAASIKIYKLTQKQSFFFTELVNHQNTENDVDINFDSQIVSYDTKLMGLKLRFLKKFIPIQNNSLKWTDLGEFKAHSFEFKINSLGTGNYILLISDTSEKGKIHSELLEFKVSNLIFNARHNPDKKIEIRVMNRETGNPLNGVRVNVIGRRQILKNDILCWDEKNEIGLTNIDGRLIVDSLESMYNFTFNLTLDSDTLNVENAYLSGQIWNEEYEYPIKKTIFFTDRQIYRPGQTVYFKGLQIQTFKEKNKIITDSLIKVTLNNADNKQVFAIKLKTNQFGTFSGSLILPNKTLNGTFKLLTANGSIDLRIEEYKKPTFKIEFQPVKEIFKFNDFITIAGKIEAFSGYGLSGARVAYRINRLKLPNTQNSDEYGYQRGIQNVEIKLDTIKTNDLGQFNLKFKAIAGPDTNSNYQYQINVDVTDETGETYSSNTSIIVGRKNMELTMNLPGLLFADSSMKAVVGIKNLNSKLISGQVSVEVYSLKNIRKIFKSRIWDTPDQFIMTKDDFVKNFPDYPYNLEDDFTKWEVIAKVFAFNLFLKGEKPGIINLSNLKKESSGIYKIVFKAKDEYEDTIIKIRYLNFINKPSEPHRINDWLIPKVTNVMPGGNAEFLIGNGYNAKVLIERYKGFKLISSDWLNLNKIQKLIKVPIIDSDKDVAIQFMMVFQNRAYSSYQPIYLSYPQKKLEIKLITFHDRLQPNQKDEWKLQIRNKNNETPTAELLATLYDASLDEIIISKDWVNVFSFDERAISEYFDWNNYRQINRASTTLFYGYLKTISNRNYEELNLFKYFESLYSRKVSRFTASAVSVSKSSQNKKNAQSSLGEFARLDTTANASTPGSSDKVIMREIVAAPSLKFNKQQPIIPRNNFAETAFFFPQLQTNDKGEVLLNFTMPEALTRWKFRGFAHTKDLQTGYIENTIVTQKQLSITANTPRFLREGDTITISARLANLADSGLKGTVQIKLFNALNMQPVSLLINRADSLQSFNIASNTNQAVSFRIAVPAGLEALTYRLTADGGQFTDGEENTLPVLPNSTLVTESMPMLVRAGQTRSFTFNRLLNQNSNSLKNKTLTLEYTQNPAWYAVQALPYMMEFPYECSEQVFSRYFANSLATNILSKMPAIKRVFDLWKTANSTELLSNLEKNMELKSTLIEETPWLNDAIGENEQKKRIALLFDLNKMGNELKLNLEKLQKRQLPNGGFAWFGGEYADRFITQHITEGIGELYHVGIANNDSTLKTMATNAIKYLDNQLLADEAWRVKNKQAKYFGDLEIHAWYTRSFFMNIPLSSAMQKLKADYLKWATANWTNRNVYEQGLIALTMLRYNKPLVTAQIEKSLLETAQHSDELGMYWAKNLQGYSWYQSPIETQSLLIALFTETGGNAKEVDEMKIWLLRNKQTNNWKTTKATAEACYALLLKGSDLLADAGKSTIKVDAKPLEQLKPEVKQDAGTGYFKTTWVDEQIKPSYGKVEITNKSKTPSWGALHWQYLEKLDKITSAETNIRLERKYYIQQQTGNGLVLTAVDAQHPAKIGDLLKVVINLKAEKDFEYVQLKDMRPSGTEPVEALSSYKYQDGLYYYQVSKDVATNFFISNLNKGSYVFEYQLRVAQPGNFSTGITSIQCMYAPEYNAHSNGERMIIKP